MTWCSQVQQAQHLISLEAEENLQMTQQLGKYPAPEVFKDKNPDTGRPIPPRPQPSKFTSTYLGWNPLKYVGKENNNFAYLPHDTL